MNVRVVVPEANMGDVMGDLNTRRGQVLGMDQVSDNTVVTALVPLAEMQRYSTSLRAFTQGRGFYTMHISHYENVPSHLAQEIVEKAKREAQES